MQDNRQRLVQEVKTKLEEALDAYYKYSGNNPEMAERAHQNYSRLKIELAELTGEEIDL